MLNNRIKFSAGGRAYCAGTSTLVWASIFRPSTTRVMGVHKFSVGGHMFATWVSNSRFRWAAKSPPSIGRPHVYGVGGHPAPVCPRPSIVDGHISPRWLSTAVHVSPLGVHLRQRWLPTAAHSEPSGCPLSRFRVAVQFSAPWASNSRLGGRPIPQPLWAATPRCGLPRFECPHLHPSCVGVHLQPVGVHPRPPLHALWAATKTPTPKG